MFHGPDGNNYVALGYNNPKESKSKVVIKVIKFNAKWKKGKTATVKGSASNEFEGIYHPIDAGTASFDMLGDTLYVFTCREMFATEDGVHHQSNIAFRIDTKKMKATVDNAVYTSHSFNQRVRFKDGDIVLADHGDGAPRGIAIGVQRDYGKGSPEVSEYVPFAFQGDFGENFTGATMGGLEVGRDTAIVCGTAHPHGYKVAGVKGVGDYTWKKNAFVVLTDLATGKSSVKWLTKINPKKGKQTVSETRMVKLTDDRFAIIYSVTNDKTRATTLHYDVVNAKGKRVLSKKYSGVEFTGSVQPVLHGGSLVWSECSYARNGGKQATIYQIPAL